MALSDGAAVPAADGPPLALFNQPTGTPKSPAQPRVLGRADWERPLRALMGPDPAPVDEASSSEIGLQFELVALRPKTGRRSVGGPGIRVRPVLPSRNGNWVKTGVTWASLEYRGYGWPETAGSSEKLGLLKEFLA